MVLAVWLENTICSGVSDVKIVVRFLLGRVFPAWDDQKMDIGPSLCYNAIASAAGSDVTIEDIENDLEAYRKTYFKYYSKNKRKDSPKIRDSNPIIFLIPKIGMISFAKDKTNARLASEFYLNAINVMKGAEGVSSYTGLSDKEAFNIEYWSLEEDKLKRLPKPKSLSGKIALITGGSGAIGKASAEKILENGGNVFLTDISQKKLNKTIQELEEKYGDILE